MKPGIRRVMIIAVLFWVAAAVGIVWDLARSEPEPWERAAFEQRVRSAIDDTVLRCWWYEGDEQPFFCEVETR